MQFDLVEKNVQDLFAFESHAKVKGFNQKSEFVPEVDSGYHFDPETTKVLLAAFENNLKVLVQGYHGTGKSSHIEQVAARLNWPCFRLNLDGHISRLDLIGKDQIILEDGQQVTKFKEGILPWAMQQPMALVLDEYDAGRPEVMFVIQRLMEQGGALTLPDQNKIIHPHPQFRLFATSNTIGLGDSTGLYHGTHHLNQAQLDRWNMVVHLNYLEESWEKEVVLSKMPQLHNSKDLIEKMITVASLTRTAFMAGDLSAVMSPRTVLMWAQNYEILDDVYQAFKLSFMNRVDPADFETLNTFYNRVFGE
ncbi:MAG: AAA family ATPase [Pseudomonadota bacterium]|nr:AAA family ATPase [Pseudomonadota bacterium]